MDAANLVGGAEAPFVPSVPWHRRWSIGRNVYDHRELAGAFGDLGTLIPFVVGYIAVMKIDPLGILFMFGLSELAVGLFYKTPIPVQPMKAIGGVAIASGGAVSAGAICGAGLFTGLAWLLLGATRTVDLATKVAAKPIIRGIVLGLGLLFMTEGIRMMLVTKVSIVLAIFSSSRPRSAPVCWLTGWIFRTTSCCKAARFLIRTRSATASATVRKGRA